MAIPFSSSLLNRTQCFWFVCLPPPLPPPYSFSYQITPLLLLLPFSSSSPTAIWSIPVFFFFLNNCYLHYYLLVFSSYFSLSPPQVRSGPFSPLSFFFPNNHHHAAQLKGIQPLRCGCDKPLKDFTIWEDSLSVSRWLCHWASRGQQGHRGTHFSWHPFRKDFMIWQIYRMLMLSLKRTAANFCWRDRDSPAVVTADWFMITVGQKFTSMSWGHVIAHGISQIWEQRKCTTSIPRIVQGACWTHQVSSCSANIGTPMTLLDSFHRASLRTNSHETEVLEHGQGGNKTSLASENAHRPRRHSDHPALARAKQTEYQFCWAPASSKKRYVVTPGETILEPERYTSASRSDIDTWGTARGSEHTLDGQGSPGSLQLSLSLGLWGKVLRFLQDLVQRKDLRARGYTVSYLNSWTSIFEECKNSAAN